jgi:signal transduction histidine kinase
MAVEMLESAEPARRAALKAEIDRDVRELDALVEEVLLASRLDAQATLNESKVDLIGLAAEEAARVGAQLHLEAPPDSLFLRADLRLVRRALRNLLENARRYGGDDVELTLRRRPDSQGKPGELITLEVGDRGPGVPSELRERIFEPFYRLPGHSEREGGVGLGLSLVRQIALRHAGSVRCDPREGGGSLFILSLPVREA